MSSAPRALGLLVLVVVLAACTGGASRPESFADAEENFFVGCLEPVDGQLAQYTDGTLVNPERHENLEQCETMWEEVQENVTLDDFLLVGDALDDQPDLLELEPDAIPTDLVDSESQQRLEDAVAELQDIAEAAGVQPGEG